MTTARDQQPLFETPRPVERLHELPQTTAAASEPPPVPPSLKLEWPSDLVQIETDAEKARAALAPQEEERVVPYPQRVRPPPLPVSNEPLMQVETRGPDLPIAGSATAREPANPVGQL